MILNMFDRKQIYALIFIHLCICNHVWKKPNMNTTVRLNHDLSSGTCLRSIPSISYSECFRRLEVETFSFNVMVYRRQFLLCKLCFVSKTLQMEKKPGYMLVHFNISDTSQENLALGKPTSQSSVYSTSAVGNAPSSLAVDGIRESTMITDADWLQKLVITVGETENSMHPCSEFEGPVGRGANVSIVCQEPMLGQFVRISKSIRETMVLCEVEVYH